MTSPELITEIEEGAVRADLALASTPYALLQRMEDNAVLAAAAHLLAANPEESTAFLQRARALYDTPAPAGCAHPGDLSLAAYVYLLAHVRQRPAQEFVDRVAASNRAEFFAASAVARHFRTQVPASAAS